VRLRAATPAQLVAALPYLFGFVPHESVIVLGLDERRVEVAARVDAAVVLGAGFNAEPLRQLLPSLAPRWRVIAVGWMADAAAAQRAVDLASSAIGGADQTIIVSGGRCRADGGAWKACPGAIAEAETAGLTPLPNRAALVARVAGAPGPDAERRWAVACEAIDEAPVSRRQQRAAELSAQGLHMPQTLSFQEHIELAALVRDGAVRDVLWDDLTWETAKRHIDLWCAVVRAVPDEGAPAALGMLGMAAWVAGDGALQVCCLERGLAIAPEHSLLRLVETINILGVHPKMWAELRRSLTSERDAAVDDPASII